MFIIDTFIQVYPELDEALLTRVMGSAKLTIMEENSFSGLSCLFCTCMKSWFFSGNNDIKNIVISIDSNLDTKTSWWSTPVCWNWGLRFRENLRKFSGKRSYYVNWTRVEAEIVKHNWKTRTVDNFRIKSDLIVWWCWDQCLFWNW